MRSGEEILLENNSRFPVICEETGSIIHKNTYISKVILGDKSKCQPLIIEKFCNDKESQIISGDKVILHVPLYGNFKGTLFHHDNSLWIAYDHLINILCYPEQFIFTIRKNTQTETSKEKENNTLDINYGDNVSFIRDNKDIQIGNTDSFNIISNNFRNDFEGNSKTLFDDKHRGTMYILFIVVIIILIIWAYLIIRSL